MDARVLDIGTGTGLLAMMAARAGAKHVTACEAFAPMAAVARNVIAANTSTTLPAAAAASIDVIAERSTSLSAGEPKVDLIVTEIFDTDLLGEGVLGSVADALRRLAKPGATVVPAGATVYVQPVQSDLLASWDGVNLEAMLTRAAAAATAAGDAAMASMLTASVAQAPAAPASPASPCTGRGLLYDLHVDMLAPYLEVLAPPAAVLEFDFARSADHVAAAAAEATTRWTAGQGPLSLRNGKGRIDALVVWWVLHLDAEAKISTAPAWVDAENAAAQWRDHWLQVPFLRNFFCVKK